MIKRVASYNSNESYYSLRKPRYAAKKLVTFRRKKKVVLERWKEREATHGAPLAEVRDGMSHAFVTLGENFILNCYSLIASSVMKGGQQSMNDKIILGNVASWKR